MSADNMATIRTWIAQARPSDRVTSIFMSAEKFNALLDGAEALEECQRKLDRNGFPTSADYLLIKLTRLMEVQ